MARPGSCLDLSLNPAEFIKEGPALEGPGRELLSLAVPSALRWL